MFDSLASRIESALDRVRGRGTLDEATVDAVLQDIRRALLEADVNLKVARAFTANLKQRLVGEDVSKALNPAQQVIKAVNEELTHALGGETATLDIGNHKPSVIMLAGLQGAGKTTAAAKLAALLKKQGRNPLLVACDLQRPAAVEQLRINAEKVGVPIHAPVTEGDPVPVAAEAIQIAKDTGRDVVIVDTAGRLHVDDELLAQARAIRDATGAHETLFVIDAMIGQEAVNVAKSFHDAVGFDGVILSKLDGDARGGAALSVRAVTAKPIKFASVGEKFDEFEVFHPDRMAGRILDMGDILTLIEKAEDTFEEEEAAKQAEAMLKGELNFETFLQQMKMMKKLGPLSGVLGMLPGMGKALKGIDVDDNALKPIEAIVLSMTLEERRNPKVLNGSRRRRIAKGSGTTVNDVNQLVKRFTQMQKMFKQMGPQGMAAMAGMGGMGGAPGMGAMPPGMGGGMPGMGAPGGFPGLMPSGGGNRATKKKRKPRKKRRK